jgi:hypothetical protein
MRGFLRKFLTPVLLCLALLPAGSSGAEVKQDGGLFIVSDATGYAPIKDGRKNEARDDAKREAYRDALEKAMGAAVTGVTEMENYQVVRDKVFSQTSGIVKSLDVTREWEEDGVLYVEAVCKVSASALDGTLGPAVLDAIGNPRIMVIIDERIGDKAPFISFAEGTALRIFEKAGYLLVDSDQARALLKLDPAVAYDDPSRIMDAARTLKADVVILGRAYASQFHKGKIEGVTMYGVKGTVSLKAVFTKTAYQITSQTAEASTGKKPALSVENGAERCFKEAVAQASGTIVNKIAYALVSGATGLPGGTVNVKITGVSFAQAETTLEALRGFVGKSGEVYEREYADSSIEFDVVSEKASRAIASFLAQRGVNVSGVTAQTITGVMGSAPREGTQVSIRISGIPSFKDAEAILSAVKEFIGSGGTVADTFADSALMMEVTSGKTAKEIASRLSELRVKIDGVTAARVSGSYKSGAI